MERARAREDRRRARRLKGSAAATLAAGAALAAAPTAEAATFNVTNLADSGAGSLRSAIAQANGAGGADTITFQSGLSGTINVGSDMAITEELAIDGPGSGAITLDGGDATQILDSTGADLTSVSGLTFTDGNSGPYPGGAISVYGGGVDLDDVIITSSSGSRGGGLFVGGNDISINDSRFSDNTTGYTGGAIATDGSSGADPADEIVITDSTVTGNQAETAGGGISFYDNYVDTTVEGSTISGNSIVDGGSSYEIGGGIWFEDTYDGASTTVSNSTVSGNSAPDGGGGVSFGENFYGPTEVVNSTIHGNSATVGGGIQFADIENVPFTLRNSTVTGNDASDTGGGVFRGYAAGNTGTNAPLDVSSSIVSGNTAPGAGSPDFATNPATAGALTIGNSLVGDTTGVTYTADPAGTVIVGEDPELGPLANNGGPTETRLPAATSPVINAGVANGLTADQRGENRTVEYPDVPNTLGSDGTDMGAVELAPPPPPVPPDDEVIDPFLEMKNPQLQGKKIKLKVRAGAGEDVTAKASGRIRLGHGNAVRLETERVAAGEQVTLVLKPENKAAKRRIKKALEEGRKAKAEIDGRLIDDAGNKYYELLKAKLKPKG
jgi:hypothetical protein